MPSGIPTITGRQLIRLLTRDGWQIAGRRTHGISLVKRGDDGHLRSTIVPDKSDDLPIGLLAAILAPKQTGIGRAGLAALIARHGLT